MQDVIGQVGRTPPTVTLDERDMDVAQMEETVLDHYRQRALEEKIDLSIGEQLDQDLVGPLRARGRRRHRRRHAAARRATGDDPRGDPVLGRLARAW